MADLAETIQHEVTDAVVNDELELPTLPEVALRIRDALRQHFPEHAERFSEGYGALAQDLDALNARLEQILRDLPKEAHILANHPAYAYVARRYGLTIHAFDLEPRQYGL